MRSPSKRWTIERRPDVFETVLATRVDALDSGGLRFYNGDAFEAREVIIYAAGQWISVFPEESA